MPNRKSVRKSVVALGSAVALLASVTLFAAGAWAMRVSPMVSELTTTGAGSAARIEVGNVGSATLPFETMITRMDMDSDGNIVETPADEDFLVFPPQGLVPVGGRQVVRVQWVGEPAVDSSQAYYLWVKQLPVVTDPNAPESGGALSVQVLYTMKALIVVAPPGAQPRVEIVSVSPAMVTPPAPQVDPSLSGDEAPPPPPAEPGVEVVVTNSGKRYALMSGATWIIEGTDKSGDAFRREYAGGEISQLVGVGYLAPLGGKRTFKLPTGVELDPAKPVNVRFAR
ncbi:molecular chaperone [Brevundimonas naejangsanensis]|uniref:Molecular chaperone n=1 Tax=Brevundimonas naejangsanensis TaxID=588932 RepID=A0A494RFZ7_9CAUL|nr:fimbria/pilus periplasmic chaperone [Brevundimonas naejangsanensis]AYG95357.1 molecular chaperone [Brevundimonas naejangsanensis]